MELTELQALFNQKFPRSYLKLKCIEGFYHIVCGDYPPREPYNLSVNTKIKSLETLGDFLVSLEPCSAYISVDYFIPRLKAFDANYTEDILCQQNNRLYERKITLVKQKSGSGYILKTWAVVSTNPKSIKIKEIPLPALKDHQVEHLVSHLLTNKVKNNVGLDLRVQQLTQLCLAFTTPSTSFCKIRDLYFISNGLDIKIGITNNIEKRVQTLQTANSRNLKVIRVLKGTESQEKAIQSLLRQFPNRGGWTESKGEWFEITKLPKDFYKLLFYPELTPQYIIRFLNGRLRLWRTYRVQSILEFRKVS